MTEHIERALALNRQACERISHGQLNAAKTALTEAIRLSSDLAAPLTNLGVLHCGAWWRKPSLCIAKHAVSTQPSRPCIPTSVSLTHGR